MGETHIVIERKIQHTGIFIQIDDRELRFAYILENKILI